MRGALSNHHLYHHDVCYYSDEDRILPIIDTTLANAQCTNKWFNSIGDARDCIEATVSAHDDCDPLVNIAVQSHQGSCEATTFPILATTARCGQVNGDSVTVKVDLASPEVECRLGGSDGDQDVRLLRSGGNVLEDIALYYAVGGPAGDCTNDVNVTVQVFANEIEDF